MSMDQSSNCCWNWRGNDRNKGSANCSSGCAWAVEDFTKAIAVNAKLKKWRSTNKSGSAFDTSQSDTREISVSDPFTAAAYTNRGLARLHLDDFDQAILDYDQA